MILLAPAATTEAAEIQVLSTPTLKTIMDEFRLPFERATGYKLVIKFDNIAALKRQIDAGKFDVAVLSLCLTDELMKQDEIAADRLGGAVVVIVRSTIQCQ